MDEILPEIVKSEALGEKLASKLFDSMTEFCEYSELNTELVHYFSTAENPDEDYSGMKWKGTDRYNTSNEITNAIISLGAVIGTCSIWPKYIEEENYSDTPVDLMKKVCIAFLQMKIDQ